MAGYGQFCPLAQASEVLAERWTPLVVRELLDGGRRFNEIHRGVPLMSSTLLSKRLRTLERAGIVERGERAGGSGAEYRLTEGGRELEPIMVSMATWSERWLRRPVTSEDADPRFLMWTVRGRPFPMGCRPNARSRTSASPTPPTSSATGGSCSSAPAPTSASRTRASGST